MIHGLDTLAELSRSVVDGEAAQEYGLENIDRFPPDFMFQLTWDEVEALRTHFVAADGAASKGHKL